MITGSLQVKSGKYYAVLRINEKQKWFSTGYTVKGNNKKAAKAEMQKILEEQEEKIEAEAIAAAKAAKRREYEGDTPFVKWIERYLANKKYDLRQITYESYIEYTDLHILPYFTELDLTLAEISPQHIRDYFNAKREGGLSTNSIKKHLAVIRGTLQLGVEDGILNYNPGYRLRLPKIEKYQSHHYNAEQAKALLEAAKDDPLEPAIILGVYYGLRRSECLGLRWRDIDFDHDIIYIKNTVVIQKTLVEKEQTKSPSSTRTLSIVPETKEYFQSLKRKQAENRLLLGNGYIPNDHVCQWGNGKAFSPNYVTTHFAYLLDKHHLPHIRFHDLRHSYVKPPLKKSKTSVISESAAA